MCRSSHTLRMTVLSAQHNQPQTHTRTPTDTHTRTPTNTHAHPPTHHNTTTPHHPPTPPPLTYTPTTNQTPQTTQRQTTHPPPTRNVTDKLSLGDKWMPCIVISCHNVPVSRLRNVRANCLPWRWPPLLKRNRHRHKRSASYHESS